MTLREHAHFGTVKWCIGRRLFFRDTHKVRDDLQLSHFVG